MAATKKLPSMQISDKVASIPEALSIYINQIVYTLRRAGEDITALSLGEAFFDLPLFDFNKIDVNKGYHYSDSQGIPELRRCIANFYGKHYHAQVSAEREILISAGSKPIIFMAMQVVLNPGDEVLIHEPAWLSYQEQARLVGCIPKFIPYDEPVEAFERHYSPKTRMVVINNPNNPAGRVYTHSDLTKLYEQCRKRGIYILVDEAYSDFADEPFHTMAKIAPDKDGVIIINSLSKNMGISGWRIGYAIGHPTFIRELLKLNQHLITCAPSILLYYLAHYFDEITSMTLPQVREVTLKRQRVAEMMRQLNLKMLSGGSTFYFFVSLENFPGNSLDFAVHLLTQHNIALVPGSAYGASTERFVRISIGTESEERIWDALQIVRDLIDSPSFDPTPSRRRLKALGLHEFGAPREPAAPAA